MIKITAGIFSVLRFFSKDFVSLKCVSATNVSPLNYSFHLKTVVITILVPDVTVILDESQMSIIMSWTFQRYTVSYPKNDSNDLNHLIIIFFFSNYIY